MDRFKKIYQQGTIDVVVTGADVGSFRYVATLNSSP